MNTIELFDKCLNLEETTHIKTEFENWANLEENKSVLYSVNVGNQTRNFFCLFDIQNRVILGFGVTRNEAITDSLKGFDEKQKAVEDILNELGDKYQFVTFMIGRKYIYA